MRGGAVTSMAGALGLDVVGPQGGGARLLLPPRPGEPAQSPPAPSAGDPAHAFVRNLARGEAYLSFAKAPETVAGWARSVGREEERYCVTTLGQLRDAELDMFCTAVVGNIGNLQHVFLRTPIRLGFVCTRHRQQRQYRRYVEYDRHRVLGDGARYDL